MEEIKLVKSRKYEDKIKEYNLQDIERHEQEILEKARKYQEYKDRRSKQNVIIRLWYRLLDALRVEYPEEKARKYQEYKDKQSKQNVIIRLWYRLLDALHGNHPERNFTIYPWHTIQETESDKWEIAYFYNSKKKTLNFDNIFHLQSSVMKSESKHKFFNVANKGLYFLDINVFRLSFMYVCLLPIASTWEFIQEFISGKSISKETWWIYLSVTFLTVALCSFLCYLGVRISRKETIALWEVAKEAKWNEKLLIFFESSAKQGLQIFYEVLYLFVLWFSVSLAFYAQVTEYSPFEALKNVPMEVFRQVIFIYCGIKLTVIVLRLFISPLGFFICSVVITVFLMNLKQWTGVTLFAALWTVLLTKEIWMLNFSSEVPEYIINPTDKSSRIIKSNLLKIKVYTSIGVLVTYYLLVLVDNSRPYYHMLLFLKLASERELKTPYYQNFTCLIDRLGVFACLSLIMLKIKDSYESDNKGLIRNIIDFLISNLNNVIYRDVKEVEEPKIKEKVGLSIAYLDIIKPTQLLENSEALPKDIQVQVEETDDPNKRKVIVIMPDLTVHSGIVEFEP